MIARNIQRPATPPAVPITLGNDTEIPADASFTFSLRTEKGARLTGKETIEVAADAGSGDATLSSSNGLKLADQHVALATIEPAKALGPLRLRRLARAHREQRRAWRVTGWRWARWCDCPGSTGWPAPTDPAAACTLSGDDLFLIDALSPTPGFEHPVTVPDGYPGTNLEVPHPAAGGLYVRLRDDPATIGRIGS